MTRTVKMQRQGIILSLLNLSLNLSKWHHFLKNTTQVETIMITIQYCNSHKEKQKTLALIFVQFSTKVVIIISPVWYFQKLVSWMLRIRSQRLKSKIMFWLKCDSDFSVLTFVFADSQFRIPRACQILHCWNTGAVFSIGTGRLQTWTKENQIIFGS